MIDAPEGVPPMVHAVAKALRARCLETFGSTWSYDVSWSLAQAAIEAMREPSDAMVKAGREQTMSTGFAAWSAWRGMVSAALAEPTKER